MSARGVIPAALSPEISAVLGRWFFFPGDVGAEGAPAASRAPLDTANVSSRGRQAR